MTPPSRPFYDDWESASPAERERVIRERLEAYIRFASENSPFYRDRLKKFDPRSPHPLAEIAPLSGGDLRDVLPPLGRSLLTTQTGGYSVFQSGGSTGIPKTTLFTNEELELLTPANGRGFHAVGLEKNDRVANLWASGSLYMTFIHMNRFLQQAGCQNFAFGNNTAPDFIHTITKLFEVNVYSGIASLVLGALRNLKPFGLEGIRVRKVYFGAEHIYDADLREFREEFGVETIKAPGYGTVDSWYIGYQCLETPLGVFHAHDDQTFLEVVDEDTGRPCPPGEAGMLYVTTFPRRLTPVVRYRVGDRVRMLPDACPCGRTTPLFQLLGRGDDQLRIGYDSIDYAAIQRVVVGFPELSGTVQIEKVRQDGKDCLVVRVESTIDPAEAPRVEGEVRTAILKDRPTLRLLVEKGAVDVPKIEIVPLASLPRNRRTGKLVRVVDAVKDDPVKG